MKAILSKIQGFNEKKKDLLIVGLLSACVSIWVQIFVRLFELTGGN